MLCCCPCSMPVSQDMNAPQWMQEQTGQDFSDVNTREASKPWASHVQGPRVSGGKWGVFVLNF